MLNNFEVITTTDKAQRDRMFADFRKNGDELERQVVKFSGNQLVGDEIVKNYAGRDHGPESGRTRQVFESTWSVAYPRS